MTSNRPRSYDSRGNGGIRLNYRRWKADGYKRGGHYLMNALVEWARENPKQALAAIAILAILLVGSNLYFAVNDCPDAVLTEQD